MEHTDATQSQRTPKQHSHGFGILMMNPEPEPCGGVGVLLAWSLLFYFLFSIIFSPFFPRWRRRRRAHKRGRYSIWLVYTHICPVVISYFNHLLLRSGSQEPAQVAIGFECPRMEELYGIVSLSLSLCASWLWTRDASIQLADTFLGSDG